jgi:hypothetical protein
MGVGDTSMLRAVDDVIRHASSVRESMRQATMVVDPLIFGQARGAAKRAKVLAAAASDVAVAERLLQPIAEREPGLAPLLDALRSARMVQGMRRPDQTATSLMFGTLRDEVRAAEAWRHVHGMDREARIAALDRFRAGTADELSTSDWKTLAGIIVDDVDGELTHGLPRTPIGGALSIRDLALNIAGEGGAHTNMQSRFFAGHTYFDAWKASAIDPAVRRTRIGELLTGDPHARTPEEWRELTGLLNAGGHDVVEHPWFPGLRPEFGARHAMLGGYDVIPKFRLGIDTASSTQLEAAARQLRSAGELDELARSIVQGDQLDRIGIVGAEASAVRLRHMEPLYPAQAKAWLTDIRAAFQGAKVNGPAVQVRDRALELVDRNLARVDGERWLRWRDGYQNYPDHAELGRVRSTWQLLEQLATPAERASAPSADAGAGALAW